MIKIRTRQCVVEDTRLECNKNPTFYRVNSIIALTRYICSLSATKGTVRFPLLIPLHLVMITKVCPSNLIEISVYKNADGYRAKLKIATGSRHCSRNAP